MPAEADIKTPIKNYFNGSSYTGVINTWRKDGHQSCQLRIPSEFLKAISPSPDIDGETVNDDGTRVPLFSPEVKAFVKYGTLELRKSDFFALAPVFVALARANGAAVTIDYGRDVPFIPRED